MTTRSAAPTTTDLDLYRKMLVIRSFEDAIQQLFLDGHVFGTTHLYSGQEAVAVGVASCMVEGDRAAATYRGHGAAIALGVSTQGLMDELLGRATGVCGGRAGSMNVIDLEHGLIGCFGIVGGSIAAATGAALAFQQRGESLVAVAFFGDGTSNQAYFHECLNLAQIWQLPVVFVCENNLYMEYTRTDAVTAGAIIDRPRAMGIATQQVDGNDLWAVQATASEAMERARRGDGPTFIEALTYRLVGHSRSDPGAYRRPGELDERTLTEPLRVTRAAILERGESEADVKAVEDSVKAELEEVVARALDAPWPNPQSSPGQFAEEHL